MSQWPAQDVHAWAGTPYHMSRALADVSDGLVYISPLRDKWPVLFRGRRLLTRVLLRREYHRQFDPIVLDSYARQVERRLHDHEVDVVFSPSTIPVAHLRCEQPIAFWSDAAFAGMVDYYPGFSRLARSTRRAGERMERAALERAALAIYSSDWAATIALDHYGVDAAKVRVVPYGANLESALTAATVAEAVDRRPEDTCRLLLIGVDWERKGGDVAVEVARRLNEAGLSTTLTIAGSVPPGGVPPFVRSLGFVSKASPEGRSLLEGLLAESHFLILPTRADCTPMVFGEANAFGVPVLTTRTGGIPTIVRDGGNGQSFPPDAPAEAYADYVLDLFADYARYRSLARTAFDEYSTRLNWTSATRTVRRMLEEFRAE